MQGIPLARALADWPGPGRVPRAVYYDDALRIPPPRPADSVHDLKELPLDALTSESI